MTPKALRKEARRIIDLELMLCEESSSVGYGRHPHIAARKR
jgi:hypothetical protein